MFLRLFTRRFVKMEAMTIMASNTQSNGKISSPASFDGVMSIEAIAGIDADTLFEIFTYKQRLIDKKSDVIEQLKQRIQILEEYLRLEKARRFGPSSEKNSNQLELLFNEAETLEESAAVETAIDALQETTGADAKGYLKRSLATRFVLISPTKKKKAPLIPSTLSSKKNWTSSQPRRG
jgi:hypothetical protein